MKAAVIDLGTNTFHLIIAELEGSGLTILYKTNVPVQLGQGRINENIITPAAFKRGIDTLIDFRRKIDEYQVQQVRAVGTSAVRGATNTPEFVAEAAEKASVNIEVITGLDEAAYIFKGVCATGIVNDTALVMDIGGGSTEFIIGNRAQVLWKNSYNLGAARLMQAYFHSDPISHEDHTAMLNFIASQVNDLRDACLRYEPKILIGSAGAFETFAAMLMPTADLSNHAAVELNISSYSQISERLLTSTHNERGGMKAIIPLRVDMIVIAAVLVDYTLDILQPEQLYLSTYDMKMGILKSMADQVAD